MLVLLLAIALAPLAFVSWRDLDAARQLGESLAGRTRDALTVAEKQKLRVWVDEKAAWARARGFQVEQTLRFQAREVERCLASSPPRPPPTAYFKDDFNRRAAPPGIHPSERHLRFDESSGTRAPIPVTYDTQVFSLAPGLTRAAAAPEIARLAPMTSAYRFLLKTGPDLIYWQYTGFENGLFCAYPGDGTSPSDYDPRQRPWYQRTKETDAMVWFGPYVDSVSRELILTASLPVHGANGRFAGVTAVDITVDHLADNLRLPAGWPKDSLSMLVGLDDEGGKPSLRIYVRPGYERDASRWREAFKPAHVQASDARGMSRLIDMIRKGGAGTELMDYEGRSALWAFGPVRSEGMYLLVITPYEQVIADALVAQQVALRQTREQARHIKVIGLAVVGLVLVLALLSAHAISQPVRELAEASRRIAAGEFSTRVNIRTHDEIQELGEAFNRMVPQLQDRMHLKQSLELAREVQQQLLPREAPRVAGFDVAGGSVYCDETGGDYFDFIEFARAGRPRFAAALGDITGHGIPAALLMAAARALLRADIADTGSPSELLARVNAQLARDVTGGRFMTLFFLEIEMDSRAAHWSSAGHDPAIRYDLSSDAFDELGGSGLPLGIDPEAKYEEGGPLPLRPGQVIVLATDGVWEAPDPQGGRFGKDRLRAVMREHARKTSAEIQTAVMDAVTVFRGIQPQADDITLVVIKVA